MIPTYLHQTNITPKRPLNMKYAREAYSVCGKDNLLSIGCNKASSICCCSAMLSPLLNLLITFYILQIIFCAFHFRFICLSRGEILKFITECNSRKRITLWCH